MMLSSTFTVCSSSGKTKNCPFTTYALSDFVWLICSNARGHFLIFASLCNYYLCVCVCAHDLYVCATGQALCHIKYPSPVDLITGGDDWNVISVPFQEHRKWEFWKRRYKILLTLIIFLFACLTIQSQHSEVKWTLSLSPRCTGCDRTWQGMWYCFIRVFDNTICTLYQITLAVKRL